MSTHRINRWILRPRAVQFENRILNDWDHHSFLTTVTITYIYYEALRHFVRYFITRPEILF
jgi:hypothetical protein